VSSGGSIGEGLTAALTWRCTDCAGRPDVCYNVSILGRGPEPKTGRFGKALSAEMIGHNSKGHADRSMQDEPENTAIAERTRLGPVALRNEEAAETKSLPYAMSGTPVSTAFKIVVAGDPKNANARYRYAIALLDEGDPVAALVQLKEALYLNPAHAEAQHEIFNLLPHLEYRAVDNHPQNNSASRPAPYSKSDDPIIKKHLWLIVNDGERNTVPAEFSTDGFARRAIISLEAKNYNDVVIACDNTLELTPDDPRIYFVRAVAHAALRQIYEAVADLEKASSLEPSDTILRSICIVQIKLYNIIGRHNDMVQAAVTLHQLENANNHHFDENNILGHIEGHLSSSAVATRQRMTGDDLNAAVKKTKAETLSRGKPPSSAVRQLANYKALIQHVDLLNAELAEDERLRRARRLIRAYERVRERKPKFQDRNKQLLAAFSILNKVKYPGRRRRKTATAQPDMAIQ
jgi:tetratricopeptide (TPR) repeat protein